MKQLINKSLVILIFMSLLLGSIANIHGGDTYPTIYLIPGQGSDYRLFKNLEIDKNFPVEHIHYTIPKEGTSMLDYAKQLAKQIDKSSPYILVGVSLGGMIATEMSTFLDPEKVIIISSAKKREELPLRYRFQKFLPIYKNIPAPLTKVGAKFLQPIVEPDRGKEKETFKAMLSAKDPLFLKRSIEMIMEWERSDYSDRIVHIHGSNDHTIPARNVDNNILVENGSHMMILTEGERLSMIINKVLLQP